MGHLLVGRYFKGALLAVLFSMTVQGLLLGWVWPESFGTSWMVLLGLAVGIWLYSLVSAWWLMRRMGTERFQQQKDRILMAGIKAMLRNDLEAASKTFRTLLRQDDRDLEGWLYLARICQLQGQTRWARRFLKVVRCLDRQGKWRWELSVLAGGTSPRDTGVTP